MSQPLYTPKEEGKDNDTSSCTTQLPDLGVPQVPAPKQVVPLLQNQKTKGGERTAPQQNKTQATTLARQDMQGQPQGQQGKAQPQQKTQLQQRAEQQIKAQELRRAIAQTKTQEEKNGNPIVSPQAKQTPAFTTNTQDSKAGSTPTNDVLSLSQIMRDVEGLGEVETKDFNLDDIDVDQLMRDVGIGMDMGISSSSATLGKPVPSQRPSSLPTKRLMVTRDTQASRSPSPSLARREDRSPGDAVKTPPLSGARATVTLGEDKVTSSEVTCTQLPVTQKAKDR
jgi:hypothetical protein